MNVSVELRVNLSKTAVIIFTRKTKFRRKTIRVSGVEVKQEKEFKYMEVTLRWGKKVSAKANRVLIACRRLTGTP